MTSATSARGRAETDEFAWVARLLTQWGAWQHGILGIGLGMAGMSGRRYSRQAVELGIPVEHGDPVFDQRMLEVDRAVASLPKPLVLLARCQYVFGADWPREHRFKHCNVSESTYYRRLDIVHAHVGTELRGGENIGRRAV